MPNWHTRVLKRGRVHLHAQTLHHGPRSDVCGRGKGDNFLKLQYLEPNLQRASRGFSGEAPSPMRLRQCVTLLARQRCREMRHDKGIGVECRKGSSI